MTIPITKSAPKANPAQCADAPKPLTRREVEVLSLLSERGLSNADIALVLGCATRTVKNHMFSIAGKLGASNRTECVVIWREMQGRRAA